MDSEDIQGMTTVEVAKQQQAHGYNQLPDREKKSFVSIVLRVLTEPMIFLLVAVVIVYFLLGDRTEAIVLMISVMVIISIELYQDSKTEKALEALRDLASPSCNVIRDGKHQIISTRELVVGDILLVAEGERVPADARLLEAENIMADESLLTGAVSYTHLDVYKRQLLKDGIIYTQRNTAHRAPGADRSRTTRKITCW